MINKFESISKSIKSRKDLHYALKNHRKCVGPKAYLVCLVEIFLPTEKVTSLRFMQQLLKGEKQYLVESQVSRIAVPYYPELSVQALIDRVSEDPRISMHLPDCEEKKKPNKEFVWHVINYF